jgi:hypothetical protein
MEPTFEDEHDNWRILTVYIRENLHAWCGLKVGTERMKIIWNREFGMSVTPYSVARCTLSWVVLLVMCGFRSCLISLGVFGTESLLKGDALPDRARCCQNIHKVWGRACPSYHMHMIPTTAKDVRMPVCNAQHCIYNAPFPCIREEGLPIFWELGGARHKRRNFLGSRVTSHLPEKFPIYLIEHAL